MAFLANNSTKAPLGPNASFNGVSTIVPVNIYSLYCSFNVDTSGTLYVYHSYDGSVYDTFGDEFVVLPEDHHREVPVKGKYLKVKYTNGAVSQVAFSLYSKFTEVSASNVLTYPNLDSCIINGVLQTSGGGGGSGGNVNITGCDVTLPISGTVDVSNFPTAFEVSNLPTTQDVSGTVAISNTSFEISNLPTTQEVSGTIAFSNTAIEISNLPATQEVSGTVAISNTSFEISNLPTTQEVSGTIAFSNTAIEISNLPTTQAVSIADPVNVNVLDTNSTIYDLTNDSSTMTGEDARFIVDIVRPDSWRFRTSKTNVAGSNVYWYSNSPVSPLGVQQFPILHGDLSSVYCVVSINKTENNNRLPFMALYSPSLSAFYTSRWIYTIDVSEQLLQTEKVLVYWGTDPAELYPNLRHIEALKNVIASEGPQLETETVYLMSINTASGEPTESIDYNLYNSGFVLNNGVHNDYQFNSGIQSKADFALSQLTVSNGANLNVQVVNTLTTNTTLTDVTFTKIITENCLNVNVANVADIPISNTSLIFMSFKEVSAGTYGLEVVNRNVQQSTNYLFTEADVTITDETPSIDVKAFRLMSVFGDSAHTGGGSHDIIIQYSTNNLIWYDSPNVIPSVANKFAFDLKDFCVGYIRFRFQVEITDLNMNVCLK